jgi:uncharacterized RDD family membrane protein YckC
MTDGMSGAPGEGPPSFPGNAPPAPPPSFPGNAPPAPQGQFPPPGTYATSTGMPYASWGLRLGGYLIDAVVFFVVAVVLYLPFHHSHTLVLHMMARRGVRRRSISAVPILLSGVLYLVYATILCGGRRGQTVGMMAVGVRVVRDGSSEVLGYGKALGRALLEQVFRLLSLAIFLLGIVWLVDMLFPLWDKKRQTLHDKVVGSVVIRTRLTG